VPASKANSLINELNSLSSVEPINELQLQKVVVEARKLKDTVERHMILGVVSCLKDDPVSWFENFNDALAVSRNESLLDAFFKSAIKLNVENKAYEYALTSTTAVFEFSTAIYAIRILLAVGDFSSAKLACDLLLKAYANQPECFNRLEDNEYFKMDAIKGFADAGVDYAAMSEITRQVMDYAFAKYGARVVNKTVELIQDDSVIASNSIFFDNIDSEALKDLDNYVLDMIISKESESNVQGFVFHLLHSGARPERLQA